MNKEKTIIAQYMITIYDNGDMETTRLTVDEQKELASKKENFIDCNIISGGTAQLLLIIKKVVEADDEWLAALDTEEEFEPDIYASIRYAIRDVSKLNGLNPMTVTNKVTRDLKDKNGEMKKISQLEVSEVVMSRIEELLTTVKKEINSLTKRQVDYIILTGGTSSLSNFQNIAEEILGPVAKCDSIKILGVRNNKYSSAVGNIVYFINKLHLKGLEYSMFEEEEIEMLNRNKEGLLSISNNSMLGKVFGYFFDE